jgi:hypothetical protein
VYVKLVLPSGKSGVDRKRELIGARRSSVRALQIGTDAPGGVEVIRRVRRLQPSVLDSNDSSRGGQNNVRQPKWCP